MNKKTLYRKLYRILGQETPLKMDCGQLCGSKCCDGTNDSGMHIYPGEECMLEHQSEFLKLRKENFSDMTLTFAICKGECNRDYRPLACRIFPLIPYISSDGKLHIIEDPRAHYQCPLLHSEDFKASGIFKRKLKILFNLAIKDPDIKNYITALSKVLEDYSVFTGSKLP